MAKVIGVTGGFGTGKTFVASILKKLGARVIDADRIAHNVIRKGSPEYKRIVREFGKDILKKGGEVDRRKLGGIVFSDAKLLRKLEEIVHPRIMKDIKRSIGRAKQEDMVVIDAPLLVEARLDRLIDKLIVVKCSKRRQIERCQEKFCLTKKEILRRIGSQIPLKKKMKMADLVIENSGTKSATRRQAEKALEAKSWR